MLWLDVRTGSLGRVSQILEVFGQYELKELVLSVTSQVIFKDANQ